MDLKQLREEAMDEFGDEQIAENKENFKRKVKSIMNEMASNINKISTLKERNAALQIELGELDIEPIAELEID